VNVFDILLRRTQKTLQVEDACPRAERTMLSNTSFHDAAGSLIPVPAGLKLFSKALSAAHVDWSLERTQAALRGFFGVVDSLEPISKWASSLPSETITEWKKRELAIHDFTTGLSDGGLAVIGYDPASGQRVVIDPLDFYTASRIDPIIRSGVVQGRPGEAIARFNGWVLLVRERDLRRRIAQFQSTSAFPKLRSAACREWLTTLMLAHPERPPMPQAALMREAKAQFGCSQRQFKLLLKQVAQETGIKWPLGRPPQNSSTPAALRDSVVESVQQPAGLAPQRVRLPPLLDRDAGE
jgi:hypothetical protein